jgi:hypothetical protein
MSEDPILMTQTQYARHRNKARSNAGVLVVRGRLALWPFLLVGAASATLAIAPP